MVSFPPCKINLGLSITGKRQDGYHDIVTCFYPVPWCDVLEIIPADHLTFTASGISIPGAAADNLCMRAYELLKKDFPLPPVAIHLLKILPIGAGLGGGSADGAYALRSLDQLFGLSIPVDRMKRYAAALGSDCPFFLENGPMIGTGRGEMLTPASVSLKGKYLVIVHPEVQISTAQAYAEVTPQPPAEDLRQILETLPVPEWKNRVKNDFERVLFPKFPIIEALHQKLYALGAAYASMSGSGSAVYGIFERERDLKEEFESVTYWSGVLP